MGARMCVSSSVEDDVGARMCVSSPVEDAVDAARHPHSHPRNDTVAAMGSTSNMDNAACNEGSEGVGLPYATPGRRRQQERLLREPGLVRDGEDLHDLRDLRHELRSLRHELLLLVGVDGRTCR